MSFFNAFLDKTILFSFDRLGFKRHLKNKPEEHYQVPAGLSAILTGATSGIGYAVAQNLALQGIKLTLICRDIQKGESTLHSLLKIAPTASIEIVPLDMGDLSAVYRFAKTVDSTNIVIHNAGNMPLTLQLTKEGDESIFASQVLGPYILTKSLLEQNKLCKEGRVIFVSSGGMYLQKLDLSDLTFQKTPYNKYTAYANAKRAQVLLTELFAQKYPFRFSSMHPGWVDTPGVAFSMPYFYKLLKQRLRTPEQGADTINWLALTATNYPSGRFWFDRSEATPYMFGMNKCSTEDFYALWNLCEGTFKRVQNA